MDARNPKNKERLLRIYKILIALFAVVLVLLPRSVTSMPEIETKLLLTVLGLDKTENGYRVTATAVMPAESQNGATTRTDVESEEVSVSAALEKLSLKMGKRLELGLCGVVVVGDTFGDESLLPHLKYLLSSGKIIPGAYLIFADGMPAKKAIEMTNALSEASSNGLSTLVEHNALNTHMSTITLLKFLSDTASVTNCAYMPILEIGVKEQEFEGSDDGGSGEGSKNASGEGSGAQTGTAEIEQINRIAIYKNGVKTGGFDPVETRGYDWTDKNNTQGLVTVKNFTAGGIEAGEVYCQLIDKRVNIDVSFEDGVPTAKVRIDALMKFEERYKLSDMNKYGGVSEKELSERMKAQFSEKIASNILSAVEAMKRLDADVSGFTDRLYRFRTKDYNAYENKESMLADLVVVPEINVKFR